MKVRRPAAVLLHGADAGKFFTARDPLAWAQLAECGLGQMAIKGEEFVTFAGFVPQYEERRGIWGRRVGGEGVHGAVERRVYGRAGSKKEFVSKMNGGALGCGFVFCLPLLGGAKLRGGKKPSLAAPANTNG